MSALAVPLNTMHSVQQRSSRRLHVLTITPFYPSVGNPIQGCFIADPVRKLSKYGIDTHVIAVSPFYRGSGQACESGSEWQKYYALPGNVGLIGAGALLRHSLRARVRQLHRFKTIDVIHAHAALPCGEAAASIAAELKVPCVVSVHGLDVFADRQCGRWLGPWAKRLSLGVYRRANKVVCISDKVRQRLPNELQAKTTVVYNGVDAELFSPAAAVNPALRILSVGNLIPVKDHALLLRAFANVLKTLPAAQLEIVGEGPERLPLHHLAATLGIQSNVIFRGRLDRSQVAAAMKASDVFALPSRYEGLGCVYLEAMACGKPAIACTGQGIDEIIRDGYNGFLIAPGDEGGMTERLLALLQDDVLHRRIGLAARETVMERCTLDHQASELAEVYRECIE